MGFSEAGHEVDLLCHPEALIGERFGNYCLERLIGRGGFADVYAAKHRHTGQRIAVKIAAARVRRPLSCLGRSRAVAVESHDFESYLRSNLAHSTSLVVREPNEVLLRECEALSRVSDPHFVKPLSTGFHRGRFYVAMEYVEGDTLRALMHDGAEIPLDLFVDLCDALTAATGDGLLYHGDLKPDNIIVNNETFKILDPSSLATNSGISLRVTTPAYNPFLERSDLPGFGCMLYELVTGFPPFSSSLLNFTASIPEDNEKTLAGEFVPASWLNPDLPPRLDSLIMRSLGLREEGSIIIHRREDEGLQLFRRGLVECFAELPSRLRVPSRQTVQAMMRVISPVLSRAASAERLQRAFDLILRQVKLTSVTVPRPSCTDDPIHDGARQVSAEAVGDRRWLCPWCAQVAKRPTRPAPLCDSRSCDCGAVALGAPPWDLDEVIDNALALFGVETRKESRGNDFLLLADLRDSGIDVRIGLLESNGQDKPRWWKYQYLWFRRGRQNSGQTT